MTRFAPLVACAIFFLAVCTLFFRPSSPDRAGVVSAASAWSDVLFPRGQISPLLRNIDDLTFHSYRLPLARLFCASVNDPLIVIAGLGEGEPLIGDPSFNARFALYEPMSQTADKFAAHMDSWTPERRARTTLNRVGAGAEAAIETITYGETETVAVERIDKRTRERVTVVSLDTQGSEFHILRGMSDLFDMRLVDVVMVETIVFGNEWKPSHNKDIPGMLNFLDVHGFVLFDCTPVGPVPGMSKLMWSTSMTSDHFVIGPRPNNIAEWYEHQRFPYVRLPDNTEPFGYVTTDIIAIHRNFLTPQLLFELTQLASRESIMSAQIDRERAAALADKEAIARPSAAFVAQWGP
jgi:hypothetical protein